MTEENYLKYGEKGIFLGLNFASAPPAENLFVGKKMNLKRGEGVGDIEMHNIYP